MEALLAFSVVLLVSVFLSDVARRSILSVALVFLAGGILLGPGVLKVVPVDARQPEIRWFADLALFSILFTDGMRVRIKDLRTSWLSPGRALLIGLPLTLLFTAVLARWLVRLSWPAALLLGAVLSPTDPVFAEAIVGNEHAPERLRRLLNVESGMNDGLALPLVIVLLEVLQRQPYHLVRLGGELALGIVLGITLPWLIGGVSRHIAVSERYQPLRGLSIGLIILSLTRLVHANGFLAAFSAGISTASFSRGVRESFQPFGDLIAELLKLAALLLFGALLSPHLLEDLPLQTYAFAVLALVLPRPAAILLSLAGSRLPCRERLAAAWFGPKGFASVLYGIFVLQSGISDSVRLFHVVAVVIALSIVLHTSTATLVARYFRQQEKEPRPEERLHTNGSAFPTG